MTIARRTITKVKVESKKEVHPKLALPISVEPETPEVGKCAVCGKKSNTFSSVLQQSFCSDDCYNKARKDSKPLVKSGTTVPIHRLHDGQRFRVEYPKMGRDGGHSDTGYLIYCTPGRALVELDGRPAKREFKNNRTGENVAFETKGSRRINFAPECEVITLEGIRDFSIHKPVASKPAKDFKLTGLKPEKSRVTRSSSMVKLSCGKTPTSGAIPAQAALVLQILREAKVALTPDELIAKMEGRVESKQTMRAVLNLYRAKMRAQGYLSETQI